MIYVTISYRKKYHSGLRRKHLVFIFVVSYVINRQFLPGDIMSHYSAVHVRIAFKFKTPKLFRRLATTN